MDSRTLEVLFYIEGSLETRIRATIIIYHFEVTCKPQEFSGRAFLLISEIPDI